MVQIERDMAGGKAKAIQDRREAERTRASVCREKDNLNHVRKSETKKDDSKEGRMEEANQRIDALATTHPKKSLSHLLH